MSWQLGHLIPDETRLPYFCLRMLYDFGEYPNFEACGLRIGIIPRATQVMSATNLGRSKNFVSAPA